MSESPLNEGLRVAVPTFPPVIWMPTGSTIWFNMPSIFKLQTGLALPYDPERTEHVAGLPVQKRHQGLCSALRYARLRKDPANPGVNYRIEETGDLKQWIDRSGSLHHGENHPDKR